MVKKVLKPFDSKQRIVYYSSILFSILGVILSLIAPLAIKNVLDQGNLNLREILIIAGVFLGASALSTLGFYQMLKFAVNQINKYRRQIIDRMIYAQVSQYDNLNSVESSSEILHASQKMQDFISRQHAAIFPNVVMIIGALAVLVYTDWKLAGVIFLALPLFALFIVPISNLNGKLTLDLNQRVNIIVGNLANNFQQIRVIKASNAQGQTSQKVNLQNDELSAISQKVGSLNAFMQPTVTIFLMLIVAFIFGYGGMRVNNGTLTIGTLIAFLIYLFQLLTPLTSLNGYFAARAEFEKLEEQLNQYLDVEEEVDQGHSFEEQFNELRLQNVQFAYGETPVLHDISMDIQAGHKVAIVGPSGSGKSTLLSLMLKFYQPDDGEMTINDHSLSTIRPSSWRDKIAYVAQEDALINGTIKDNLSLGLNQLPTEEEMMKALEQAELKEDVEKLSDGLNTFIGESGQLLSGGQRQRLQIARAILRQPELLFFDEATSSLDSETEYLITQRLFEVFDNTTSVMIAHRLSTIISSDQIYFLEDGRITGRGTHEELMQSHEKYRQYVNYQTLQPTENE